MKQLFIILVTALVVVPTFAEGKKEKMSVEERKAKVVANIDKRISSLNEFKTCASAAADVAAIKACRAAHKSRVKGTEE